MGSHMNFKNSGAGQLQDGNGGGTGRPMENFSLVRQPSIYSLTFDEFQNSMGSIGKDFGSMNMDEFLKNIWTAEETQSMAAVATSASPFLGAAVEGGFGVPGGNLQRQGSLTLPRTLSQKTVDEVWRDLFIKESGGGGGGGFVKDVNSNGGGSNFQQRQQTLGEMTLEEFLVRAGVVREDAQPSPGIGIRPNNNGIFGEFSQSNNNNNNNNTGLALGFPESVRSNGTMSNRILESNNPPSNQSPNLGININGIRSSQQPQKQQQQQQQQQIFPKPTTVAYASPAHLANTVQLANPGIRGTIVGMADPTMNNGLVQGGGMGMVGLGTGAVTVATGSPANQLSSDGFGKSNGDTSSLSPVPYVFNGGPRGRKCSGAVEKVVERRQRRMIKNRESAARSRARKQAYTMELEAEVAKLKEENEELQKKQAEIMELQKNQALEMIQQLGTKRRCLRRTQTGPW